MSPALFVERREEWNALVRALPRVDFRQSWEWGAFRVSDGWGVVRAAVVAGQRALVAAQVLVRRVPGIGRVLYVPRGPLLADDAESVPALADLMALLRRRIGGIFVRASPGVADGDAASYTARLQAGGFVALPDLWSVWNTPRNIMRLDLTGSEPALLARMARKRRQHVSTGERKGVWTEVSADLGTLRTFHALHVEHGRLHNYPVPGWPALNTLYREFGGADGLAVVTGLVKQELAGMLVGIRFGPVAHTLYLATTPAAHHTPVGDLLHWALIRWAREAGCLELDLGSSCTDVPPTETHPNYGIYRFKSELGARLALCVGYHDCVFAPLRYGIARRLEAHAHHVNRRLLGRLRLGLLGGRDGVPDAAPQPQAS
jgi:lipid II:glycine glycyltransferase (peptidoglycan interpeptide bridge formation enzyme)